MNEYPVIFKVLFYWNINILIINLFNIQHLLANTDL